MVVQARLALHYIRGDQASQQLQRLLQRHREQGGSAAAAGDSAAAAAMAGEARDVDLLLEGALLLVSAARCCVADS